MYESHIKPRYLSNRLWGKLQRIADHPWTAIAAPLGYGKTTAMQEYLKVTRADYIWISGLKHPCFDFWQEFCDAFAVRDVQLGDELKTVGMESLGPSHWSDMRSYVSSKLPEKTILVIDNYHLIFSAEVDSFLKSFVRFVTPRFSMVTISRRSVPETVAELTMDFMPSRIAMEDLAFSPKDIERFFANGGYRLKREEIDWLYQKSEGWPAFLDLSLAAYEENGTLTAPDSLEAIVKYQVYEPLPEDCKKMLAYPAAIGDFTKEEMCYLWGKENGPELLQILLDENAFFTYQVSQKRYHVHPVLMKEIQIHFQGLPEEEQKEIFEKASDWYMQKKVYPEAMKCAFLCGNFHQLMEAVGCGLGGGMESISKERIFRYFEGCPAGIIKQHPKALLCYMEKMTAIGDTVRWERAREGFIAAVEQLNVNDEEARKLMAEYEMVMGEACCNDLARMDAHYRMAAFYLKQDVLEEDFSSRWLFSSPSVVSVFYQESGILDGSLEQYKIAAEFYSALTGSGGCGSVDAAVAETDYLRGSMARGELAALRAAKQSREGHQWDVMLAASFQAERIHFFNGNWAAVSGCLDADEALLKEKNQLRRMHLTELCRAWFYALLGEKKRIAEWVVKRDFTEDRVLYPAIPMANVIYGAALLCNERYVELLTEGDFLIQEADQGHSLLSKLYLYIELASASICSGRVSEAERYLGKALQIAEPDQIYMPFVEFGKYIMPLLERCRNKKCRIFELYLQYAKGLAQIQEQYFAKRWNGLTDREYEVARFTAQGLSNKELAERLFISENTVKSTLKNVYGKLEIKSRRELMIQFETIFKSGGDC